MRKIRDFTNECKETYKEAGTVQINNYKLYYDLEVPQNPPLLIESLLETDSHQLTRLLCLPLLF